MGWFMRGAAAWLVMALLVGPAMADKPPEPTPAQKAYAEKMNALRRDLHPMTGDVKIPATDVTLHLGQRYYFLPAAEARRVLIEAWRNPKNGQDDVLGLIFPAGKDFNDDDAWGAVVTFIADGYISDQNAAGQDYTKVLNDFREGEDERNESRKAEGLEPSHLIGWATAPSYDRASHSLIWAREIKYGEQTDHTLNYDVRLLGRRGALSLNMISNTSALPSIKAAAVDLAKTAEFQPGARYSDYKSGDPTAAYGLAGLVAGGVGLLVAKKLGLLAVILAFGKKAFVLIAAGVAAAVAWVRRRLNLKPKPKPEKAKAEPPSGYSVSGPAEPQDPADSKSPWG